MLRVCAISILACAASNPFEGHTFYVNPANQKEYDSSIATASGIVKSNLQEMRNVPSAYWIDVKAKVHGTGTESLAGILADANAKSPKELVVLIFYDLPNRDCDAKASNGEICCYANADGTCNYDKSGDCAEGITEYKSEYVDPFVAEVAKYKGSGLPIVLVVEPDSLPNLASNLGHPHCGNSATQNAYKQGIKYAMDELTSKTDATLYMDAAHGGWLGWSDNMDAYIALLKGMNLPLNKIRGFATNVANYQPMGELCPWAPDQGYRNGYCLNGRHSDDACCADPCKLEGQWNPANNELNFAQALIKSANGSLDWDARAIIDTGRNGVADMRQTCQNWCNIRGAGAGIKSTIQTAAPEMIDAYFWLKTPGESDGCSQTLPSGESCPRYDSMCGSTDSIGTHSDEPPAPEAGAWFDYQVKQLAENAHMKPGPAPTPRPTPPAPSPVPTPQPGPVPPTPVPTPLPTPSPSPAGAKCCWGFPLSCDGASDCHADAFCDSDEGSCTGSCSGVWCARPSIEV